MDRTLTLTTTPGQNGYGSNGYEGATPYIPKLQNLIFTTRKNLV